MRCTQISFWSYEALRTTLPSHLQKGFPIEDFIHTTTVGLREISMDRDNEEVWPSKSLEEFFLFFFFSPVPTSYLWKMNSNLLAWAWKNCPFSTILVRMLSGTLSQDGNLAICTFFFKAHAFLSTQKFHILGRHIIGKVILCGVKTRKKPKCCHWGHIKCYSYTSEYCTAVKKSEILG